MNYLSPDQRHRLCCQLADKALNSFSEKQIIELCPQDYGASVTDDHRNFIWNNLYDEYNSLDDGELSLRAHYVLERKASNEF